MAYTQAIGLGNPLGFACLARLLEQSGRSAKAQAYWDMFLDKLPGPDEACFIAEPEALIWVYLAGRHQAGEEPCVRPIMRAYTYERHYTG